MQRVTEYIDYSPQPTGGTHYFTADHLGTPRVITNNQGAVASRHDFMPFGEEIMAGTGGRSVQTGHVIDDVRQKFTGKERDEETGLDYFNARYYANTQGRFTSADPVKITPARTHDPQRINLYVYCRNNPLIYIDVDGRDLVLANPTAHTQIRGNMDAALRENERKNIQIVGDKVLLVDKNAIDLSKASPAYRRLVGVIQDSSTTRYYGIAPGESASLTYPEGTRGSFTYNEIHQNQGSTVLYDNGDRDVFVPMANDMTVEGASGGQIPFPEWRSWWHEIVGHTTKASNAVAIENEIAKSVGEPPRSGGDHRNINEPASFSLIVRSEQEIPEIKITPVLDEKLLTLKPIVRPQ